jgi:1,2-phenylacetyl-CoA epoxidase PaaB subunit
MGRVTLHCLHCRRLMQASRKHLEVSRIVRCGACHALKGLPDQEHALLLARARQIRRAKGVGP